MDKSTRWTWWRRLFANLAAVAVGVVAAALSWRHIVHTAKVYGHEPDWAAMLYPVPIDGMMIVGVVMAADDRATGRLVRPWARVATWAGGVLSIANQMASAYVYGWSAVIVAVIPSGSLIITVEVLARRGRMLQEAEALALAEATAEVKDAPVAPEVSPVEPVPTPEPEPVVAPTATTEAPEEPPAAPPRSKPRKRRRPALKGYPGPTDDILEATIVGSHEHREIAPAFVGSAVVDRDADMG